ESLALPSQPVRQTRTTDVKRSKCRTHLVEFWIALSRLLAGLLGPIQRSVRPCLTVSIAREGWVDQSCDEVACELDGAVASTVAHGFIKPGISRSPRCGYREVLNRYDFAAV